MFFKDRIDAGCRLAQKLSEYAGRENLLVLGLPRGGVPVAFEVAAKLGAPLDVFVVRKLGTPGHKELAMGALASGGVRVINPEVLSRVINAEVTLEAATQSESMELTRREALYREGRLPLSVKNQTVLVVDDGLATGATMRAAVAALRKLGAAQIVVAIPVGAASTCALLEKEADRVVCLHAPETFWAVGNFYDDFSQTSDHEVRDYLAKAALVRHP